MAAYFTDSDDEDYHLFRGFPPISVGQRDENPSLTATEFGDYDPDLDFDLEFAFRLELEEALAASRALKPPSATNGDRDAVDQRAESLTTPFGEGSSRTAGESSNEAFFSVYFRGLAAAEKAGIGVAIYDPRGVLVFEAKKPLLGGETSRVAAEAQAMVQALSEALALGLKRIVLHCQNLIIHNYILGRWKVKQRKLVPLINKAKMFQQRFVAWGSRSVPWYNKNIKFVTKLAREAIDSQLPNNTDAKTSALETCVICLEDNKPSQIFSVENCKHRFCFSCTRQHVEYKLRNALMPKCPHEDCKSELKLSSCEVFLTPKFVALMRQREKEEKTPVPERVYCPNPRCSALMSRAEAADFSRREGITVGRVGARTCVKCRGLFCVDCKVAWHQNMSCFEHRLRNPNPAPEEAKLKRLASENMWRQCKKCKLVIELAVGCYHMICRCGYEFCYKCGSEWKNKDSRCCSCPLWNENNILYEDEDEDKYFDEDEDEDEDKYFDEDVDEDFDEDDDEDEAFDEDEDEDEDFDEDEDEDFDEDEDDIALRLAIDELGDEFFDGSGLLFFNRYDGRFI